MNKRKKMAIIKHRRKRKKFEVRRKALSLLAGSQRPVVKEPVKQEKEMPKPVKAIVDLLKPKAATAAKKVAPKKEKPVAVKKVEAVEKADKSKKAPVKAKKTEAAVKPKAAEKAEAPKKTAVKKGKPESAKGS